MTEIISRQMIIFKSKEKNLVVVPDVTPLNLSGCQSNIQHT